MSAASQDPGSTAGTSPSRPPAPAPAPRAPAPQRKTPLWARLLILAAFGCAGFVLLCCALVAVGVWWLVSPPRQVPTTSLVAPTSIGVACTEALAEDAGLIEALRHVNEEIVALQEEEARRGTPEWLRGLQGEPQGVPLGVMLMAVPEDATLVIERASADGPLGWAFAANFRWLVRPIQWLITSENRHGPRHHSVDGVSVDETRRSGVCNAFVGGTFVVTSDLPTMRLAIRRLKAARSGGEVARLPLDLPSMHEGWDAVGLLSDVRGDREALLDLLGDTRARGTAGRVLAADLSGLDVGVDIETADRVCARISIDAVDRLAIEDWAADLEALLEEWRAMAETKGLRLDSRIDLQRDEIRVELTLDGVKQWLADRVRNRGW